MAWRTRAKTRSRKTTVANRTGTIVVGRLPAPSTRPGAGARAADHTDHHAFAEVDVVPV